MISTKEGGLSVYNGNYKPITLYKNAEKIEGFEKSGISGNAGVVEGSYNDTLTLYGKSGYKSSPNLFPSIKTCGEEFDDGDESYSWQITENGDGTFNFSGAMATGYTVGQVTLPAGSYVAHGCSLIELWIESVGNFSTLPCSFTLEQEETVLAVLWYTATEATTLENQYLQIEKGSVATEFTPYCGNPEKPPSPDNIRPLIGAKGRVNSWGKNLFNYAAQNVDICISNCLIVEKFENGAILKGNDTGTGVASYANGWFQPGVYLYENNAVSSLDLTAGDLVTISCDYTVLEKSHPESQEPIGVYLYGVNNMTSQLIACPPIGVKTRVSRTYNITVNGKYYPVFTLNSNKVKIENIQVEYGDKATEYHPYFGEDSLDGPELLGLEVQSLLPYNYSETINGVTHYYISDVMDGNLVTHNVKKVELTGNEYQWYNEIGYSQSDEYIMFVVRCEEVIGFNVGLCSHFANTPNCSAEKRDGVFSNIPTSWYNLNFLVSKSRIPNLDEWKKYLAEQYAAGTPVTLYCVASEPTKEALFIRDTQSGAFGKRQIKTFPRATAISVYPDKNYLAYGLNDAVKVTANR